MHEPLITGVGGLVDFLIQFLAVVKKGWIGFGFSIQFAMFSDLVSGSGLHWKWHNTCQQKFSVGGCILDNKLSKKMQVGPFFLLTLPGLGDFQASAGCVLFVGCWNDGMFVQFHMTVDGLLGLALTISIFYVL